MFKVSVMDMRVKGTSHIYVCKRYQSCMCVLKVPVMYIMLKVPVIYMCAKGTSYAYVC